MTSAGRSSVLVQPSGAGRRPRRSHSAILFVGAPLSPQSQNCGSGGPGLRGRRTSSRRPPGCPSPRSVPFRSKERHHHAPDLPGGKL